MNQSIKTYILVIIFLFYLYFPLTNWIKWHLSHTQLPWTQRVLNFGHPVLFYLHQYSKFPSYKILLPRPKVLLVPCLMSHSAMMISDLNNCCIQSPHYHFLYTNMTHVHFWLKYITKGHSIDLNHYLNSHFEEATPCILVFMLSWWFQFDPCVLGVGPEMAQCVEIKSRERNSLVQIIYGCAWPVEGTVYVRLTGAGNLCSYQNARHAQSRPFFHSELIQFISYAFRIVPEWKRIHVVLQEQDTMAKSVVRMMSCNISAQYNLGELRLLSFHRNAFIII